MSLSLSVHGCVSGRQHKCVVRVLILAAAVVYLCVCTSCVQFCLLGVGGPAIYPTPLNRGLRLVTAVGSNSPSKDPTQPPWISMLFPPRDFFPPTSPRPPFPLAHSAFPRQGPAAPSSFLLNHLLTLKSKPILV